MRSLKVKAWRVVGRSIIILIIPNRYYLVILTLFEIYLLIVYHAFVFWSSGYSNVYFNYIFGLTECKYFS